MDRVEFAHQGHEIWFPPDGALVCCDAEGYPAVFEADEKNFVFLWSADRTDDEILADIRTLLRAGFVGPLVCRRVEGDALAEGAGDNYALLLDCPLAAAHTVERVATCCQGGRDK